MQNSMLSKSPRSSPPNRRELYISFNHLHKNLGPYVEDSESEEEDYLPKKKEPWRKRQIPDYRKVKIGEYYNDTPVESKPIAATEGSGGESDKSARSSFDSDLIREPVEINHQTNHQEGNQRPEETHHHSKNPVSCSGCSTVFTPTTTKHTPRPSVDSYEFAKMRYMAGQKGLKLETKSKEQEKFRCNWPGCRMVFCKPCALLMKTPKTSGGVGGNLKDLQDLLALKRKAQTPAEDSSVVSQQFAKASNCNKETPNAAMFFSGGKSDERAVTKLILNQDKTQNMTQKDDLRNSPLDVSVGIVVTVKELGYANKP